jgi:hypothetical protein
MVGVRPSAGGCIVTTTGSLGRDASPARSQTGQRQICPDSGEKNRRPWGYEMVCRRMGRTIFKRVVPPRDGALDASLWVCVAAPGSHLTIRSHHFLSSCLHHRPRC